MLFLGPDLLGQELRQIGVMEARSAAGLKCPSNLTQIQLKDIGFGVNKQVEAEDEVSSLVRDSQQGATIIDPELAPLVCSKPGSASVDTFGR